MSNGVTAVWYKQPERLSRVTLKQSRGQLNQRGPTAVCVSAQVGQRESITLAAALHMSATILPATRVSKMLVVAKLKTFLRATYRQITAINRSYLGVYEKMHCSKDWNGLLLFFTCFRKKLYVHQVCIYLIKNTAKTVILSMIKQRLLYILKNTMYLLMQKLRIQQPLLQSSVSV